MTESESELRDQHSTHEEGSALAAPRGLGQPVEIVPFRDPQALADFLNQPLLKIAEALTGLLSMGRSDAVLATGRIAQAALRGKILTQLGREIRQLVEKGKIKEDYASTKYGYKSLVELLEFIDSEVPDEDRYEAVRTMFEAINSVDAKEGEEILNYELLQISKKLTASQLLTLKAAFDVYKLKLFEGRAMVAATDWLRQVADRVGHKSVGLAEQDESVLISNGLVTGRVHPDRSGIIATNGRLTDLAIAFCQRMVKYGSWHPPADPRT
jgi:hypothetical protein